MAIKPLMSDAQFEALGACIGRAGPVLTATAERYTDTRTVRTLIAMAKPGRRWVTLNYGRNGAGHRCITSATATNAGRSAYRLETERREREAATARQLDPALGQTSTPELAR